jgi:hypothetical protein
MIDTLGLAMGVLGVTVAIYTHLCTRNVRSMVWDSHPVRGLESTDMGSPSGVGPSDLNEVATRLVVFNDGTVPLRSADIAHPGGVLISPVTGVSIRTVRIVRTNSPRSRWSLAQVSDGVDWLLRFDFLERGGGVVLDVRHTDRLGAALQCSAHVIGSGEINRRFVRARRRWGQPQFGCLYIVIMALAAGFGFLARAAGLSLGPFMPYPMETLFDRVVAIGGGVLFLAMGIIGVGIFGRLEFYSPVLPRGLQVYEGE